MVFGYHIAKHGKRQKQKPQAKIHADKATNFVNYAINRRLSISQGTALIQRNIALRHFWPNGWPNGLIHREDIVFYSWILANETVISIPDPVVEVFKHSDSTSHQPRKLSDTKKTVNTLFDASKIPASLMRWKQYFYSDCLLSLFRIQYQTGDHEVARQTYIQALRHRPSNILRVSYLRKYLRLLQLFPGRH